MSATTTLLRTDSRTGERGGLSPLRLHWLGVALLLGANTFLLVRLGMLWHGASSHNAGAIAQQRIALKTADAAAQPLRGVDAKVARSTADADRFYRERLPMVQSQVVAELGAVAKRSNVRWTRATYAQAVALAGTSGELTEEKIDASLSGDYRPLIEFINALERDRMFFVIDGVTLTGQQTGVVNLRLGLTTYLRGDANEAAEADTGSSGTDADAKGAKR